MLEFDPELRHMALPNNPGRQLTFVVLFLVDEFHVEHLCHHGDGDFQYVLGESLPETYAFAAVKGSERKVASLLARRSP